VADVTAKDEPVAAKDDRAAELPDPGVPVEEVVPEDPAALAEFLFGKAESSGGVGAEAAGEAGTAAGVTDGAEDAEADEADEAGRSGEAGEVADAGEGGDSVEGAEAGASAETAERAPGAGDAELVEPPEEDGATAGAAEVEPSDSAHDSGYADDYDDVEDSAEQESDLAPGTELQGRYRVKRVVGRGAMGTVYEGEHIVLQRRVAIKLLNLTRMHQDEAIVRFVREARTASSIGHQHIVDVTDFGTTESGTPFLVMEFIEGKPLDVIIQEEGPMPWETVREIALQICSALAATHAGGIIHRDLKPANILLQERGNEIFVKVMDFGVAKVAEFEREDPSLTQPGKVYGTPEFLSPEQALGRDVDARADIYALGGVMFNMLVADTPFVGANAVETMTKHIIEAPRRPSDVRPELRIPEEADDIIARALAKKPDDRFGSMIEMASALELTLVPLLGGSSGAAGGKTAPRGATARRVGRDTREEHGPPSTIRGREDTRTRLRSPQRPTTAPYTAANTRGRRSSSPGSPPEGLDEILPAVAAVKDDLGDYSERDTELVEMGVRAANAISKGLNLGRVSSVELQGREGRWLGVTVRERDMIVAATHPGTDLQMRLSEID
jgi:serine/threonine protein kinase